jgi:hypothetical protein
MSVRYSVIPAKAGIQRKSDYFKDYNGILASCSIKNLTNSKSFAKAGFLPSQE